MFDPKNVKLDMVNNPVSFTTGERYLVRDLIKIPVERFFRSPDNTGIILVFDGDPEYPTPESQEVVSNVRELIQGRLIWEIYQLYPIPCISPRHHLNGKGNYVGTTDSVMLNDILWSSKKLCDAKGIPLDIDNILDHKYRIIDLVDYFVRNHLGRFVVSISIRDFHEIMADEKIKEATDKLEAIDCPTPPDIAESYSVSQMRIKRNKGLKFNPVVMASKSSSIKGPQLLKVINANGIVTEVDSKFFDRAPIKSSFTKGLNTLVELAVESRTSAMSIYYQSDAMKTSEYFTRRLQSVTSIIDTVHKGVDCGTTNYATFVVPDQCNLEDLMGKYYYDEDQGKEVLIDNKNLDLRGRVIKLRSPIKCQLPSRSGVCERCYGQMADSLMEGDNVGQVASTNLQEKQSQRILSNKHHIASAIADMFTFGGRDANFLYTVGKNSDIYMHKKHQGKNIRLVFSSKEAVRLQDIVYVENLDTISPIRLTKLKFIRLDFIKDGMVVNQAPIQVSNNVRFAYFSLDALKYIRDTGWAVDEQGNYSVPLDGWDTSKPLMGLPLVQYSTPEHMKAVESYVVTKAKAKPSGEIDYSMARNCIASSPTPDHALSTFYDLIQGSLRVNIVYLEIIVLAMMVQSIEENDYRVPLNKAIGMMGSYDDLMTRRDLALGLSYEAHDQKIFQEPDTYTNKYRQPHPFNKLPGG